MTTQINATVAQQAINASIVQPAITASVQQTAVDATITQTAINASISQTAINASINQPAIDVQLVQASYLVGDLEEWIQGSGVPASGLGDDGDFYLDGATGDVYEKVAAVWGVVANIRGPQGVPGLDATPHDPDGGFF